MTCHDFPCLTSLVVGSGRGNEVDDHEGGGMTGGGLGDIHNTNTNTLPSSCIYQKGIISYNLEYHSISIPLLHPLILTLSVPPPPRPLHTHKPSLLLPMTVPGGGIGGMAPVSSATSPRNDANNGGAGATSQRPDDVDNRGDSR